MNLNALVMIAVGILAANPVWAQTSDKSQYHLFKPTPKGEMREFSTDRPDRTESPYSVDAGHFQMETDIASYTYEKTGAQVRRALSINFMNIKVGLTNRVDFQALFETLRHTRTQKPGTDNREITVGDRIVRLKMNLIGNDEGKFAIGVMPAFNFEQGPSLLIPAATELPFEFSLGGMLQWNRIQDPPEGDAYNDWIGTLALSRSIFGGLGGYMEIFALYADSPLVGWKPTFDVGLTWMVINDFQLDAGVNIGIYDPGNFWNPFLGLSFRL